MSKCCSPCDILFFCSFRLRTLASLCKNDACGTIKALLIFKGVFIRINGDSDVTLCTQSNSFIGNPAALEYIMYCLSETKGFHFKYTKDEKNACYHADKRLRVTKKKRKKRG